jgi:pheromone a factor receptor
MTIWALVKGHLEINEILAGFKNLNRSFHFRLVALASAELLIGIPWSVYSSLYLNISANGASESPINPYKSWGDVHAKFSHVGQFPAVLWKQDHTVVVSLELSRWAKVLCAFMFFVFFGFAQEARKNYRLAFNSMTKMVGYMNLTHHGSSNSSGSREPMSWTGSNTIPVFITRETAYKRDTRVSFSTDLSLEDVVGTLEDEELHSLAK